MPSSVDITLQVKLAGLAKIKDLNNALRILKGVSDRFSQAGATQAQAVKKAQDGIVNAARNTAAQQQAITRANLVAAQKAMNDRLKSSQQSHRKETSALAQELQRRAKLTQANIAQDGRMANAAMQARLKSNVAAERALTNLTQRTQKLTNAQKEALRAEMAWNREKKRSAELMKTLAGRIQLYEERVDAIFRAGFRLQMLGNDMQRVGEKIIGMLAGATQEFGAFEFMINRAAGAMGILTDETDRGVNVYDRLQKRIMETAQELRLFDPAEVAKATYFWASTSGQQVDTLQDLERALKAVNPLMRIAAMTQTDYETAIKGTYSILVQYGKGIDQVGAVTAELFRTTLLTAAEFPDLVNSFKMVGPVARANNVTFEQMVNLFGKLADAGIRGTMSGRAFRQFFIQIVRPSEIAKKALDNLWASTKQFGGKTYEEMVFPSGQFVGPEKYIRLLALALNDVTQAQRNFTLARITTANELPVLTALVANEIKILRTGTNELEKNAKMQETAAQMFERAWGLLRNSWLGVVGAIQRGLEILRIQLGRRIAAIFSPVIEKLTERLGEISDWFDDQRNGPMIDFFIKLAGGTGAFLVAAGAITVFVGSLTSLGAAIVLAAGAFGPLINKAGAVLGVLTGLAGAITRNFDYIKRTLVGAAENISVAFGGTEGSINSLSDAIEVFGAATRPVFDVVVRSVVDVVNGITRLVRAVMEFGPANFVLSGFGKAIVTLFAARTIANVLGLTRAFNFLTKAIVVNTGASVASAVSLIKVDGGMIKATKSAGLLSRALKFIGPGGILVLGVAFAGLAYEAIPEVRRAVDRLVLSFKDFKAAAADAFKTLDLWQNQVRDSMTRNWQYQELAGEIETARIKYQQAVESGNPVDLFVTKRDYDNALNNLSAFEETFANQYQVFVDELRASNVDIGLDEFMAQANRYAKGLNITLEDGARLARVYFSTQANGGETTVKSLTEAFSKIRNLFTKTDGTQGPLASWNPAKWLALSFGSSNVAAAMADQSAKELLEQYNKSLINAGTTGFVPGADSINRKLSDSFILSMARILPQLSPEMEAVISEVVSKGHEGGLAGALEDIEGDADEAAKIMYGDLASAMLSNMEALTDIDKKLKEAIKKSLKPGEIASSFIKSALKGVVSTGFKDPNGQYSKTAHLEAMGFLQTLDAALKDAQSTYTPAGFADWSKKAIAKWNKDFGSAVLGANVSDDVRRGLETYITGVYSGMGLPVPPGVIAQIWSTSKDAGEHIPEGTKAGVEDPVKVKSVQDAVTELRRKTLLKFEFGDAGYNAGTGLLNNFMRGLNSAYGPLLERVNQIARGIAAPLKHSTPTVGPLKDDDQWFYHMGMSLAAGLDRSRSAVHRAAMATASSAASAFDQIVDPLGGSMSLSTQRKIVVEVQVTSPDNSVDRLKAAQLERALQTSDLVLGLEHMVTVG